MVVRFFKKIIMFLLAFNPMYIILATKSIIQVQTDENINWTSFNCWFVSSLIVLFIITLIIGIFYVFKPSKSEKAEIEIISAKNLTGNYFLEYFSLFGLLALSFDITNPYMLIVLALIMLLISVVYIANNLYYINPLFNLLGYKFVCIRYKNVNGDKVKEANIFTKKSLEKEIGSVIYVENSVFDYSREIVKKKTY